MNHTSNLSKKFYFVRHGMTDWNLNQLCQGQQDIELNEIGRLEAKSLANSMKEVPFSTICVSPLKRAFETATILHNMKPTSKLQIIEELKERGWGKLEGISSKEMYHIEEMEEKNLHPPFESGIEPRITFQSRVLRGLSLALREEGDPLIISHGRVFLSICELLKIPLIRQIPNTTLIECSPTKHGWQIYPTGVVA